MKNVLFIFSFLAAATLFAQQPVPSAKGAAPITNHPSPLTSVTRAVVVGISDYQDEGIPDLRFANRDAEAFAHFLRSPSGGALDGDHLKVLLDHDATKGQLVAALDWLLEESQEGDQAIIYFSGHGDVESKYRSQSGYLLTWDSPSKSYMAGAFNVRDLQDIVSTMSIDKKVRVMLVTDACRSGKLAGSEIGGAQITGSSLSQQFANELKILSCQPNEYSIEGEQWGGGRGAFSYHLVDALYGMADANGDGAVTLAEVSRYLEDHVTPEVSPMSQVPMTVGNRTEKLTQVSKEALAMFVKNKGKGSPIFAQVETRGIEEDVLAAADSSVRRQYRAFKRAVKEHRFFVPKGDCADDLYNLLVLENSIARLHSSMRRNYAAALMDEFQQWLNWYVNQGGNSDGMLYSLTEFRLQLERASELLGKEHYMHDMLQSYLLSFKGNTFQVQFKASLNPVLLDSAIFYYDQSLAIFPENVATLAEQVAVHRYKQDFKTALQYHQRAVELSPNRADDWVTSCAIHLALQNFGEAVLHYNKALKLNPNYWVGRTFIYPDLFHPMFNQLMLAALATDTTNAVNFSVIGISHLANHRFSDAEQFFQKAMSKDANDVTSHLGMGLLRMYRRQPEEAHAHFQKTAMTSNRRALGAYALCLALQGKTGEAEALLQPHLQRFQTTKPSELWYAHAVVLQLSNQVDSARAVIRDMESAKAFNDGKTYFQLQLAQCRQALVEDKPAEALNYLRQTFEGIHQRDMHFKWWAMFHLRSDATFDALTRTPEAAALMAQCLPWKE